MPKERGDSSLSNDSSGTSCYPSSSSSVRRSAPKIALESEESIKEWEEARCPVCMDHPHNAILLICASHEKGCRPYMCNTSYRHSNCLDKFCKSFLETSPPRSPPPPPPPTTTTTPQVEDQFSDSNLSHLQTSEANPIDTQEERSEGSVTDHMFCYEDHSKPKLVCPLCRGQIKEWKVAEAARNFMNEKSRSCSCETCNFSGTYTELRKHARLEHPLARPSEVDPERQRRWRRLERQRDLADLLSTLQSSFGENRFHDSGGLLAVFFLVPQPSSESTRLQMRIRRRSTRLWGETFLEESSESSDGGSGTWTRRVRRRITPEDQP